MASVSHLAYPVSWVCWQLHAGWKRPTGPERSPHRAAGHVPLRSPRGAPHRWAADWSWARLRSKAWGSPGGPPNTLSGPVEPPGRPASPRLVDLPDHRMLNQTAVPQSRAGPGGRPPRTKSHPRAAAGRWTPESDYCPESGCRRLSGLPRELHRSHGSGESASHCPVGKEGPGPPWGRWIQWIQMRTEWRRKRWRSSRGWAACSYWAGGWPSWQRRPGCSPADCCCNWPSRGYSGADRHSDGPHSGSWIPRSQQMCFLRQRI